MAEQDLKQVVNNAILDADSLERFINGSDSETVLTRLSAEYPTLQKAIKELFENGGIAGRFETLTELETSELIDGQFALVANDADNKNGVYIKKDGSWFMTNYNPTRKVDVVKSELLGDKKLDAEFMDGGAITPAGTSQLVSLGAGRQYVRVVVDGLDKVKVSGAIPVESSISNWHWVVVDKSMKNRLLQTDFTGDGVIDIPQGGYYLVRNTKLDGINNADLRFYETIDDGSANLRDVYNKLGNTVKKYPTVVTLDYQVLSGATVMTNHSVSDILAYGSDRAYMRVNVSKVSHITVENSVGRPKDLDWVFADADGNKVGYVVNTGNGTFEVPDDAVTGYRTFRLPKAYGFVESSDVSIEGLRVYPKADSELYDDIESLKSDVNRLEFQRTDTASIIKNSGMPLLKLSSFAGANSDEKIRNGISYIKRAGKGILDLEEGVHIVESAILLPSNCWLYLNNATIKLKDGVFDNIIRSEGIEVPSDPYEIATVIHESRNIRVFGNGIDVSGVHGATKPYEAVNPIKGGDPVPWTGDWYGWRTIGILLANVKNYALHDFNMRDNAAWAISMGHGCEDFEVYNLDFLNNSKNGDGVHMVVGCKNGYVHDIQGYTADDMVAITATRDFVTQHPRGNYVYPMAVGGWSDRGEGVDVTDIVIENIHGSGIYAAVRLLCSGGAKMHRISVNKIREDVPNGFWYRCVIFGTGYGTAAEWGDIKDIYINDVKARYNTLAVLINAKITDCILNDISQENVNGNLIDSTNAEFRNVQITNTEGY